MAIPLLNAKTVGEDALAYDSGERDLTGVLNPNYTAALFTIQRVGRLVTVTFEDLVPPTGGTGYVIGTAALPSGFRPAGERGFTASPSTGASIRCRVRMDGVALHGAAAGAAYSGTVTYLVQPSIPTIVPGTPK